MNTSPFSESLTHFVVFPHREQRNRVCKIAGYFAALHREQRALQVSLCFVFVFRGRQSTSPRVVVYPVQFECWFRPSCVFSLHLFTGSVAEQNPLKRAHAHTSTSTSTKTKTKTHTQIFTHTRHLSHTQYGDWSAWTQCADLQSMCDGLVASVVGNSTRTRDMLEGGQLCCCAHMLALCCDSRKHGRVFEIACV